MPSVSPNIARMLLTQMIQWANSQFNAVWLAHQTQGEPTAEIEKSETNQRPPN
jgi:hypothetical protein